MTASKLSEALGVGVAVATLRTTGRKVDSLIIEELVENWLSDLETVVDDIGSL